MPIYEFACPKCRRIFSFLSKRVNPDRLPRCPKCGSTAREYKLILGATVKASASFKAAVEGPERRSGRHRPRQEQWGGVFPRADGRGHVYREMVVNRDHDPPYKWHRVTDERSGVVEKNLVRSRLDDQGGQA